jgi:hypothetical protein
MTVFVGPLYVPAVNNKYYLGQIYSRIWHNPTSQLLKLVSVVVFFLFIDLLNHRQDPKIERIKKFF